MILIPQVIWKPFTQKMLNASGQHDTYEYGTPYNTTL